MRTKAAPAFILTALALCLSGCRNPASSTIQESGSSPAKTGSITASVGTGASSSGSTGKTIVPPVVGSVTSVVVTATSGTTVLTQTIAGSSGTATFAGLVSGSSWSLSGIAYNSAGVAVGSGSVASVSPGPNSVQLPIKYTGNGTTGDLNITLSWPVSTGVDYLSWRLSNGDSSATDFHGTTPTGANWSVPIMDTGLAEGTYTLVLDFKTGGASGAPAGSFVEAVNIVAGQTSSSWIDGGVVKGGPMLLDPTLLFSSDSSLAKLEFSQGTLGKAYSPTVFLYGFTAPLSGSIAFTLTPSAAAQSISCFWNGTAASMTSNPDGTKSTGSLAIDPSISDKLVITVTAPNRTTSSIYTIRIPKSISDAAALANIANDLSGFYELAGDIAVSGAWAPLGGDGASWTSQGFSGSFDGKNKTIKVNSFTSRNFAGIFGIVASGGTVENVHVECQVASGPSGMNYVGALAGYNDGIIIHCYSTGVLNIPGGACIGGLVGQNGSVTDPTASPMIIECYSTVTVSGGYEIGGLSGGLGDLSGSTSTILNSYARGNVTATSAPDGDAGGLIGDFRNTGVIANCYAATAALSGPATGALAGGHILGSPGTVANSYYDNSAAMSGAIYSCGVGYSTAQMRSAISFAGWDFASVWGIDPSINDGYPYLRYFGSSTSSPNGLTISLDLGTQGLTFNPALATFSRGSTATIACANTTLASGGSNWRWYKDGSLAQTGPTYSWTTGSTDNLGQHTISCLVDYLGMTYSGQLVLTIED